MNSMNQQNTDNDQKKRNAKQSMNLKVAADKMKDYLFENELIQHGRQRINYDSQEWLSATDRNDNDTQIMVNLRKSVVKDNVDTNVREEETSLFVEESNWIINSENTYRKSWDLWFLLPCVLYTAIRVPYAIGANINEFDSDQFGWFIINRFIDCVFVFDIILIFSTSIPDGHKILTNRWLLAKHYFRTWFIFDLLSTFPLDLILFLASGTNNGHEDLGSRSTKILKVAKIFRILRILRLTKIPKLTAILEIVLGINFGLMSIIKYIFTFAMLAHLLACGLLTVGHEEKHSDLRGWQVNPDNVSTNTIKEKYIAAMHYAIQTLTTIGYGDLLLTTDTERVFCIVAMCVGGCCFTYMITRVVYLASMMDKSQTHLTNQLSMITEWSHYHKFSIQLLDELKTFFVYKNRTQYFDEEAMMNKLSSSLRRQVYHYMYSSFFSTCGIFDDCGESLLLELMMRIETEVAPPNTLLIEEGEAVYSMMCIRRGHLGLYTRRGGNRVLQARIFGVGGTILEQALFEPGYKSPTSVVSLEWSDIALLHRNKFRELFPFYPKEVLEMYRKVENLQHVASEGTRVSLLNTPEMKAFKMADNWKSDMTNVLAAASMKSDIEEDEDEIESEDESEDTEENEKMKHLLSDELINIEDSMQRISNLILQRK